MRATLLLAFAVFTAAGYAGTLTTSAIILYDATVVRDIPGTTRSDTGSVSFTIPDAAGDENFSSSAEASANYGMLSGKTELHGDLRRGHFALAVSEASFDDLLNITPGVSLIQFVFTITGNIMQAPGDTTFTTGQLFVQFNQHIEMFFFTGDTQATSIWLPVPAGVPAPLRVHFRTHIGGETEGTVDGVADFSHTVILSGVNARDASGNPLTNFSVIGDSGTNYLDVQNVPEPKSIVLLLSGTALLFFGRRRTR